MSMVFVLSLRDLAPLSAAAELVVLRGIYVWCRILKAFFFNLRSISVVKKNKKLAC